MIKGDPYVIGVVTVAALAIAHVVFSVFTQGVRLQSVADELEIQRQDSVRYAESIAAADSLEARRDTLQAKAQIIRGIDSDRFTWAHILDAVSTSLPDYTWLTGMRQTGGTGSTVQFRIDGLTGATQALTRFMRNLEESPFLRDVQLVQQEQIQQGQRLVHNFVLTVWYQVPDSSAIVTEPIILAGE
jgi:Tfp pilus assembly protein PilN